MLEPIDYLVVGHLTCDLTPRGQSLGGGASYAALTAKTMGLRAGIVTVCGNDVSLDSLKGVSVIRVPVERSTTFENHYTEQGRVQVVHHVAPGVGLSLIPEEWHSTPILHLSPVAREVEPALPTFIRPQLLGLSVQGWLRQWDEQGQVTRSTWTPSSLCRRGIVFISMEDVSRDEQEIERLAAASRVLLVTDGANGGRLYQNSSLSQFSAPRAVEVDATGAGDVFAAAFLARMYATNNSQESVRFACQMAAISVTRPGLTGISTPEEVQSCLNRA